MLVLALAPMHAPTFSLQASWTVIGQRDANGSPIFRHECNACGIVSKDVATQSEADALRDAHDRAEHRGAARWDVAAGVWFVPEDAADTPAGLAAHYPGQVFAWEGDVATFQVAPVRSFAV